MRLNLNPLSIYILSLDVNEKLKTIYIRLVFKKFQFDNFQKNRQTIGSEIRKRRILKILYVAKQPIIASKNRQTIDSEMNKENIIPQLIPNA